MSICAGYISALPPIESESIKQIIENFSVLNGDSESDVVRIIHTKYGPQLCKYNVDTPTQPYMAQDSNGNFLMILGFFRRYAAQKKADIDKLLLQLCVQEDAAALEKEEGQFVAVFVEGPSGIVHIVNDRFGSRPFYFLRTNRGTFYASNLTFVFRLANISPVPDPLGWLQIFRFGHTLGRTTNCVGAQRLRPGTHLTITPDRIVERTYWKLEHKLENDLDPDSFADEVFEAFKASATWRARRSPRSIIALSGGLDSRLVAACVPKKLDITAFTFVNSVESSNTAEVSTASEVARRLGLPHEIKRIELGTYSRTADTVVRLTDGLVALHHPSKTMQYIGRLGKGCNYLLGGGPGDVLAGSYVPDGTYLDPSRTADLVDGFCVNRGLGPAFLSMIFGEDFLNEWVPKLGYSILESFSDVTGPTAAHRVTAWAMKVRQPAFTFTTPFHNHPTLEEGISHLGYRYSDLMLKLPADWLLFRNFYSYMIHRCLPQLRDVIYGNTGKLLSGRLHEFNCSSIKPLNFKDQLKSHLKRLPLAQTVRDMLPMELTLRPRYTFDYSILGRDEVLLKSTEDLLDLPVVSELVDNQRCRRFIQKFRKGQIQTTSSGDAALLGSLATLCFYMKNLQRHSS